MMCREINWDEEGEVNYIFDTYLNTWRKNLYAGTIANHVYYDTQRVTLEDLIGRGAKTIIACPDDHPQLIQGWACYEIKDGAAILHYLYERPGYEVIKFLLSNIPATQPGLLTHKLPFKELKAWKLVPEIARRKNL